MVSIIHPWARLQSSQTCRTQKQGTVENTIESLSHGRQVVYRGRCDRCFAGHAGPELWIWEFWHRYSETEGRWSTHRYDKARQAQERVRGQLGETSIGEILREKLQATESWFPIAWNCYSKRSNGPGVHCSGIMVFGKQVNQGDHPIICHSFAGLVCWISRA